MSKSTVAMNMCTDKSYMASHIEFDYDLKWCKSVGITVFTVSVITAFGDCVMNIIFWPSCSAVVYDATDDMNNYHNALLEMVV